MSHIFGFTLTVLRVVTPIEWKLKIVFESSSTGVCPKIFYTSSFLLPATAALEYFRNSFRKINVCMLLTAEWTWLCTLKKYGGDGKLHIIQAICGLIGSLNKKNQFTELERPQWGDALLNHLLGKSKFFDGMCHCVAKFLAKVKGGGGVNLTLQISIDTVHWIQLLVGFVSKLEPNE